MAVLIFATVAPVSALEGFNSFNFVRIRWSQVDNRDFSDDGDSQNNFDQVLESQGSYEPLKGYSLGWKVKFGEGTWGYDYGQDDHTQHANEDAEFELEKMYVKIDQDKFRFDIGLIPAEFGNAWALQSDGITGTMLQLRPAAGWTLDLLYSKLDENDLGSYDPVTAYNFNESGAAVARDETGTEDHDLFGLQVGRRTENFGLNAYWISSLNDGDNDTTVVQEGDYGEGDTHALGISTRFKLGKVDFNGEATHFSGENDATGNDYVGNQFHLGGTYPMPSGWLQGNIYYAQAADSDETQIQSIYKQGKVQPFQQGFGMMMDHDDDYLKILPKPTSIFQITPNSGVIGAGINGGYKPIPPLTLSAGLMYLQPEDEDLDHSAGMNGNLTAWTSLAVVNLGATYEFNKHVTVGVGGSYKDFDSDDGSLDPAYALSSMFLFFF